MSIFNMSLSASFVILAAIVLRWFFIYRLPKKAFLLLWAVVLFRLLIPLSMPSSLSVWNMVDELLETASETTAVSAKVFQPFPSGNLGAQERTEPKITHQAALSSARRAGNRTGFRADSSSLLFGLWLSGATFCFLWFLLPHLRCRRTYKTAMPVKNIFVARWLADHPLRRRLSVRQSGSVEAPLTYGILRPVILLPQTMDLRDETRLSHVLAHEYFHVRHFDALWKWVLAMTLAVHWFNPFVWLMYVFACRDIELFCDETVVHSTGERAKPVYAMTLLDLEGRRGLQWGLCANFNGNTVEERIISIMKTKRASCLSILTALLMIVGTTALFATDRAVVTRAAVGYTERMLFTTRDSAVVKVTYDGATWQAYPAVTDRENWNWYTEQEYVEHMKQVAVWAQTQNFQDNKYSLDWNSLLANTSMRGVESDPAKLAQTLADIQNGIRVSKPKTIYLKYGTAPNSESIGWVHWYCYGYTFQDDAGNTVDLGLFETRDELFHALKRYYDGQVSAGTLTEAEVSLRYGKIAHNTRNLDEVPLPEKLLNRHAYNPYNTF